MPYGTTYLVGQTSTLRVLKSQCLYKQYNDCVDWVLPNCCLKEMVFTCECSCWVQHLLADDQRVSGAVTRKALFYLNRLSHKCQHVMS